MSENIHNKTVRIKEHCIPVFERKDVVRMTTDSLVIHSTSLGTKPNY